MYSPLELSYIKLQLRVIASITSLSVSKRILNEYMVRLVIVTYSEFGTARRRRKRPYWLANNSCFVKSGTGDEGFKEKL